MTEELQFSDKEPLIPNHKEDDSLPVFKEIDAFSGITPSEKNDDGDDFDVAINPTNLHKMNVNDDSKSSSANNSPKIIKTTTKPKNKTKKKDNNEIRQRMKKYLDEKRKKLEQEDKLSKFKFKPNCFSKYYALCCLNCDKLTKNYLQTICQQLLLPSFL